MVEALPAEGPQGVAYPSQEGEEGRKSLDRQWLKKQCRKTTTRYQIWKIVLNNVQARLCKKKTYHLINICPLDKMKFSTSCDANNDEFATNVGKNFATSTRRFCAPSVCQTVKHFDELVIQLRWL